LWAYRLDGPGFVSRYERADDDRKLGAGQVRLRFKAAGLCGSDMPKLNGIVVRKGDISHEIPVSDAQAAYSPYARPQAGRLKVAIVGS
jgi:D-arabinose 1-dehydrogenase-like Zn-dependent alcohol dehydrogenase